MLIFGTRPEHFLHVLNFENRGPVERKASFLEVDLGINLAPCSAIQFLYISLISANKPEDARGLDGFNKLEMACILFFCPKYLHKLTGALN